MPTCQHGGGSGKIAVVRRVYSRFRRAIELFGGIGYTWEFGAHMWLKRAAFDRNYFGRLSLHRARATRTWQDGNTYRF